MINLEVPAKFRTLINQSHQVAVEVLRANSRKYDLAEHEYPTELDMLAALVDGLNASGSTGTGATGVRRTESNDDGGTRNGTNLSTVLSILEASWGDVALVLSMPRQGLGNAAIASVANDEQHERFAGVWAAMAITEPGCGSDSAAIRTTAVRDGEDYLINGEKIYVTAGQRADAVVVWASLDKAQGRAAIKSFVVEKGTPGMVVERLERKLGIRASDTATIRFTDCRVPARNLLGSPEINADQGFAGAMQTFDNTRPLVAAMALGVAKAALDETRQILTEAGVEIDYDRPPLTQSAAAATFLQLEADWEAGYLMTLEAAWLADNNKPNSLQASMAKAKAGRSGTAITLRCVQLAGAVGYTERGLLEKWARDSKILDIFEGTQQIQQLIVARRLLGKSSAELK
ncbi:MAG: acyl-CoA dehydrogenase family protein [Actinomycetota bacterium]|nr:acyl-CoA dehydrogenase family protein [Actinomycetota bacterium]MDQ2956788.1 acyl-CoA dehydrogenase family protein [Actinomycetota bacterium]